MRAAIYARILLTLCLLALATSASAEVAWVMWSQKHPEDTAWTFVSAYPHYLGCVQGLDQLQAGWAKSPSATVFRLNPIRLGTIDGQERSTYYCVPDTIDPRGPKGK